MTRSVPVAIAITAVVIGAALAFDIMLTGGAGTVFLLGMLSDVG